MLDLDPILDVARKAGKAIMEVYSMDFQVDPEDDKSLVTIAGARSHRIICDSLSALHPDVPILSEEGKEIPFETRRNWNKFWIVNPLDGTEEFIHLINEFTVNIALVENNTPVLGVIYIPADDSFFLGVQHQGCWKITASERKELKVASSLSPDSLVRIVRSRSHPEPQIHLFLSAISSFQVKNRGCSLKFCDVADGKADFYPRFGPTWEWDTAAGQAIVMAAGGMMLEFSGIPFLYNKPSLVNGPFLVSSSLEWLEKSGVMEVALQLSQKSR